MSRIGQLPIPLPAGVTVTQDNDTITVKGPKGTLTRTLPPAIEIKVEDNQVVATRPSDSKEHRSLHGLVRSLVNNMVVGVNQNYEKRMQVIGVGFRAELQGKNLQLTVGLSHPVLVEPMPGIEFEVGQDTNTRMPFVIIRGIDKEAVGQQAANMRAVRPPSPYKKPTERMSKGIRYFGEQVRLKAGKSGKAGGKK